MICHPERSEGSPIAKNKNVRNEILRLTAQNDNACVGVGVLDDPLFLPLTREVARRSRDGGREPEKISPPVKCNAFDSPLVRGGKNGGRFVNHPYNP